MALSDWQAQKNTDKDSICRPTFHFGSKTTLYLYNHQREAKDTRGAIAKKKLVHRSSERDKLRKLDQEIVQVSSDSIPRIVISVKFVKQLSMLVLANLH